jgi:hypothetical protein
MRLQKEDGKVTTRKLRNGDEWAIYLDGIEGRKVCLRTVDHSFSSIEARVLLNPAEALFLAGELVKTVARMKEVDVDQETNAG